MKGQFSRDSFNPDRAYSGVYQQQGRMLTDADWNELVQIVKHRIEHTVGSAIQSGSPRHGGILDPEINLDQSDPNQPIIADAHLRWGGIFVDGLYAEILPPEGTHEQPSSSRDLVTNQRHGIVNPEPLEGTYSLYVDVWERLVVALEDANLVDAALHNADTCVRTQTLAQLKLLANPEGAPWHELESPRSRGNARLTVFSECDRGVPSERTQTGRAALGQNFLFRLEVHEVQGHGHAPTQVTLKWSRENGGEQYPNDLEQIPTNFWQRNCLYEYFTINDEKQLGFAAVIEPGSDQYPWHPTRPALLPCEASGTPPAAAPTDTSLFVRRWDGKCTLSKHDGIDWELSTVIAQDAEAKLEVVERDEEAAFEAFTSHPELTLRLGELAQKFTLQITRTDGEPVSFVTGDYWLAAVRSHSGRPVEIASTEPAGITHHYLEIGTLTVTKKPEGPSEWTLAMTPEQLRQWSFPALAALSADRVGYDPSLTQSRWADINEPSGPAPHTVQDALDQLVDNLEASDVRYTFRNEETTSYGVPTLESLIKSDVDIEASHTAPRIKALWDAVLTKLDASRIPYNPALKESRWRDIKEDNTQEELLEPATVQSALDDLIENLESSDVNHQLPACPAESSARSLLPSLQSIANGSPVKIKTLLNAFLCELDATRIPLDVGTETTIKHQLENLPANDVKYTLPQYSPGTVGEQVFGEEPEDTAITSSVALDGLLQRRVERRSSFDYVHLEWSAGVSDDGPIILPDRSLATGFNLAASELLGAWGNTAEVDLKVARVLTTYLEPELVHTNEVSAVYSALKNKNLELALEQAVPDYMPHLNNAYAIIDFAKAGPWGHWRLCLLRQGRRDIVEMAAEASNGLDLEGRLLQAGMNGVIPEIRAGFAVPIGGPLPLLNLPPPELPHVVVEMAFRARLVASGPVYLAIGGITTPPSPGSFVALHGEEKPTTPWSPVTLRRRVRHLSAFPMDRTARLWACAYRGDAYIDSLEIDSRSLGGPDSVLERRAPPADTSRLLNLTLHHDGGEISLNPPFNPDTTSYHASAGVHRWVTLIGTTEHNHATLTVDDVPTASGQASNPIRVGFKGKKVTVHLRQLSGDIKSYNIDIDRMLSQTDLLRASNAGRYDRFGSSVSLSGDVLAVGAYGEDGDDDATWYSGAAYVFRRQTDGAWRGEDVLRASNAGEGDGFGYSVSLSGDVLAVGAPNENGDDDAAPSSGAVYVFRRHPDGSWVQEGAPIRASNAGEGDGFGYSVSLSGDVLAVGANGENGDDDATANSGAAYVLRRHPDGSWVQEDGPIRASNAGEGDKFGSSVSLSGDVLAVGAPYENGDDDAAPYSGAVYVFRRHPDGSWVQEDGPIRASNAGEGDWFGYSVSLSGDVLAVGAPNEDGDDDATWYSGAAYVFRRHPEGSWRQEGVPIRASNADQGDAFGTSVSLSGDVLAVGANWENGESDATIDSGAVYVFRRHPDGSWVQKDGPIRASNAGYDDRFGISVSLSGDVLAVGARDEDGEGVFIKDSGAVYVFE